LLFNSQVEKLSVHRIVTSNIFNELKIDLITKNVSDKRMKLELIDTQQISSFSLF